MQPNKQMVQSADRSFSNKDSNAKDTNIFNLRIPQEFIFIQFVYHCQKYSKHNM